MSRLLTLAPFRARNCVVEYPIPELRVDYDMSP